jgi:UPF0176 protein
MICIAALYHFTRFPDPAAIRAELQGHADRLGIMGSLLIAGEGVNGTIAGSRDGLDAMLAVLREQPCCEGLVHKESFADVMPFGRMKVKLKREIVTMGQPDVDPTARVGAYVTPADWNALIADPDVAVIDTRNDYEVAIGTFQGAVDPGIRSFRDFPRWWQDNRDQFQGKRIAMFCTGGIRCEKSTNFLLGQGVNEVYHLQGGILKYLEDVPAENSLWDGQCYVFDARVSVGHGLEVGHYDSCHACRRPIDAAAKASPLYEEGVSCPKCQGEYDDTDRARFRERMRQMKLAEARGQAHLGANGAG